MEYLGGFRALDYDPNAFYDSSMASDGKVSWSSQIANISASMESAVAVLNVGFPAIDWGFLQSTYGWAALQYQAWARGSLAVDADAHQTLVLYTDNLLEFRIDDQLYFGGDFYAYRQAPLVLHLGPGSHRIDVRLIRDVRVMGGNRSPGVRIKLEAQKSQGGLVFGAPLAPDIVDGKLASNLASVSVRNEGPKWVDVLEVQPGNVRTCIQIDHVRGH